MEIERSHPCNRKSPLQQNYKETLVKSQADYRGILIPGNTALHPPVCVPVGTDVGVIGDLVVVHPALALQNEPLLLSVSADAGSTSDGLLEVSVDGRSGDGVQSLQLTRSGHVHSL